MLPTHAVGIDLGTTYSCIASLNEHGEPITLANQEGELATPSVVLFDGDEVIVGTEALRNAIAHPDQVVQNAKRFMGDRDHRWVINGRPYTPIDISAFILKKLLSAAQEQIGPIERAVITVPAQFSDAQRHATLEAGHKAGLQQVDLINEPVAAALCYVLGSEGLWFTELAQEQRIMVFDLGGGTFDLSLVKYSKNEVGVIASSGDLHLGGIDWNQMLQEAVCNQFVQQFHEDPREDSESLQALAWEVEQTKRSLSVRPRAALTCQHAGHRKTYQIQLERFEKLTKPLVDRTATITKRLLKDNKMGWAHVDVVLTTGGASRMPMIRNRLKQLSGRTLNKALSPDLSIAHGATYYAGMLLTNSKFARSILSEQARERLSQVKQHSVNARALGILVRDVERNVRFPHYLIPPNTTLPTSATQQFGTVIPNQRRVHLQIVESGTDEEQPPVKLGSCVIDELPPELPVGSEVAVTIRYDEQARVHVSAKDVTSGKTAHAEIVRQENVKPQLTTDQKDDFAVMPEEGVPFSGGASPRAAAKGRPLNGQGPASSSDSVQTASVDSEANKQDSLLESSSLPIPLCNTCGEPLDARGRCPACGASQKGQTRPQTSAKPAGPSKSSRKARPRPVKRVPPKPRSPSPPAPLPEGEGTGARATQRTEGRTVAPPADDEEIIELDKGSGEDRAAKSTRRSPEAASKTARPKKGTAGRTPPRKTAQSPKTKQPKPRKPSDPVEAGEEEFWRYVGE